MCPLLSFHLHPLPSLRLFFLSFLFRHWARPHTSLLFSHPSPVQTSLVAEWVNVHLQSGRHEGRSLLSDGEERWEQLVGSVLGSLSCLMQHRGYDPPVSYTISLTASTPSGKRRSSRAGDSGGQTPLSRSSYTSDLKGDMVVETRATLKVVSTKAECLRIYSKIEKVALLSLPRTQVALGDRESNPFVVTTNTSCTRR